MNFTSKSEDNEELVYKVSCFCLQEITQAIQGVAATSWEKVVVLGMLLLLALSC